MGTKFLLVRDEHREPRRYIEDGPHLAEIQKMLPKMWTVEVRELLTVKELREWFEKFPKIGANL